MYTINYNGFTLENDDNHTINKLEGISRVETRVSSDPLTGGPGGNIWNRQPDMRTIVVGGYVFADDFPTYYAKRNELLSAFSLAAGGAILTITRPDGTSKTAVAKVIDIPVMPESEGEFAEAYYEFLLKCEDPYFLSSITHTDTCGLAAAGGTPVPSPVASPIGSLAGNTIVIENNGDFAAQATFTLSNSMQTPTVYNQTTLEYFQIAQTLIDGDTVQVYKNNTGEYVLKNGTSIYSSFSGVIFDIAVGQNIIQLGAATYSATAVLTIVWTERFLTF